MNGAKTKHKKATKKTAPLAEKLPPRLSLRRQLLRFYFLTREDEQDPDCDLQNEGGADEGDGGAVEGGAGPLLQHGFQLGGVCHQQGHIQHALGCALPVGVVIQIQRGAAARPSIWTGGLGRGKRDDVHDFGEEDALRFSPAETVMPQRLCAFCTLAAKIRLLF